MDEDVERVLAQYDALIREERDVRNRSELGAEPDRRLLAVGPETGRLINILARSLKAPNIVEIGTSYGYSTIWLAEAARAAGGRVTTMELHDYKSEYASAMAASAGLAPYIDFQVGDAVERIGELPFAIDFVLLDLWKDLYVPCLEALYPKLAPGAIVVADNMISPPSEGAQQYVRAVRMKPDMHCVQVPVGSGLEISRFDPAKPPLREAD